MKFSSADGSVGGPLDPRGSEASTIAHLWWVMVALGALAFAVFAFGLARGLMRRSDSDPDDNSASHRWILGGGVVLPVILIVVVLAATFGAMRSIATADDDAEFRVAVTAHQYWWEVRYPEHDIVTANEIHLPADTRVAIELTSADVIHSFWVPALAGKLDALPERTNRLVIDAEPGTYEGRCAEFCGVSHANMDFVVVAHEAEGFADWVATQQQPAASAMSDRAERGATLFTQAGCGSCHRVAQPSDGMPEPGSHAGPDLTHVATRQSILGGAADPTVPDLVEWISDPHSVKPGAQMPASQLSDDEVDAIVAYLSELP